MSGLGLQLIAVLCGYNIVQLGQRVHYDFEVPVELEKSTYQSSMLIG